MRPLRISLLLAASALQWACVDEARTEAAAAHARDSALTHDLVVAGFDSAAILPAGRDIAPGTSARIVTVSPGDLATNDAGYGPAGPATSARNASVPSAPSAEAFIGPSCASPAEDDQRRCLRGYLERSDVQLDHRYQALITQLKAEAGTHFRGIEPPVVKRLRATQRNWLAYRDDECRKRTAASEGPLWAPVRAKCLAEYSTLREKEFDDALSQRKSTMKSTPPAKRKATKQAKRSKSRRHGRR
jgi:uncharacterized protein YecT (DUF1311 family)